MTNHTPRPKEGQLMLSMMIGKGIRYPLIAATLDPLQCTQVQKAFTWAALGCTGVVRTAPHIVVNCPIVYGGMDLRTDIGELQYINHVKLIMGTNLP